MKHSFLIWIESITSQCISNPEGNFIIIIALLQYLKSIEIIRIGGLIKNKRKLQIYACYSSPPTRQASIMSIETICDTFLWISRLSNIICVCVLFFIFIFKFHFASAHLALPSHAMFCVFISSHILTEHISFSRAHPEPGSLSSVHSLLLYQCF